MPYKWRCWQLGLIALHGVEVLANKMNLKFHSVPREFNLPFRTCLFPATCCRGYAISFGIGQLDD